MDDTLFSSSRQGWHDHHNVAFSSSSFIDVSRSNSFFFLLSHSAWWMTLLCKRRKVLLLAKAICVLGNLKNHICFFFGESWQERKLIIEEFCSGQDPIRCRRLGFSHAHGRTRFVHQPFWTRALHGRYWLWIRHLFLSTMGTRNRHLTGKTDDDVFLALLLRNAGQWGSRIPTLFSHIHSVLLLVIVWRIGGLIHRMWAPDLLGGVW